MRMDRICTKQIHNQGERQKVPAKKYILLNMRFTAPAALIPHFFHELQNHGYFLTLSHARTPLFS